MKTLHFLSPLFVCLLVVLSSHVLLAQEITYSIGTTELPVTANEYCAFLNKKAQTIDPDCLNSFRRKNEYSTSLHSNSQHKDTDFFDATIMDPNSVGFCISRSTIDGSFHTPAYCTGIVEVGPGFHSYIYQYTVEEGKGDFIIESVSSEYIQQSFNLWRQNPTLQELADYLNYKIQSILNVKNEFSGNENYLSSLRNRYPNNQAIFDQADNIALSFCSRDIQYQPKAVDDGDGPALMISLNYVISVMRQEYYKRPLSLSRSCCF